MKSFLRRFLCAATVGMSCASASAQAPIAPVVPLDPTPPVTMMSTSTNAVIMQPDVPVTQGMWVQTDYLLFAMKSGAATVPLVTSSNNPATIGAIGEPGTRVIFGAGAGDNIYQDLFSGIRLTGGYSFGPLLSMEASAFVLFQREIGFNAFSNGGADDQISIPFNATQPFNGNPAGETSLNAGGAANTVTISAPSRFWGTELNFILNNRRTETTSVDFLVGYRYMQLKEGLGINDTFSDPITGGIVSINDRFDTQNEYYGAQVGARGSIQLGRFTFRGTAKVSVGVINQSLTTSGESLVTNGAFGFASGNTPGGVFTQASNLGTYRNSDVAVAPEFQFDAAYSVSERFRIHAGYNFLALTNVVRPGNNIDRNVNPTQNNVFGGGGPIVGSATPVATLNTSDFWVQGLNVGLEFRW